MNIGISYCSEEKVFTIAFYKKEKMFVLRFEDTEKVYELIKLKRFLVKYENEEIVMYGDLECCSWWINELECAVDKFELGKAKCVAYSRFSNDAKAIYWLCESLK